MPPPYSQPRLQQRQLLRGQRRRTPWAAAPSSRRPRSGGYSGCSYAQSDNYVALSTRNSVFQGIDVL